MEKLVLGERWESMDNGFRGFRTVGELIAVLEMFPPESKVYFQRATINDRGEISNGKEYPIDEVVLEDETNNVILFSFENQGEGL